MNYPLRKISKDEFPPSLLEIPEPPDELYVRGEMPSPDAVLLCVVGSRKYTNYGKDVCEELISGLAGYNIVIVSGLALGTDATAHRSALKAGLKTLAIPGSGLNDDVIYPRSHFGLARDILKSGGALLSEFLPDFRATVWSFPKRNRIMAGLCGATLIIEASERSGTLITARLALDYNRDVYVVPNSIFADSSKGSNRLIRQGAMPITSSEDILSELGFDKSDKVNDMDKNSLSSLHNCSEKEIEIIAILENPMPRNELAKKLGVGISEANQLLMILEIKGLIKEETGLIRKR